MIVNKVLRIISTLKLENQGHVLNFTVQGYFGNLTTKEYFHNFYILKNAFNV